MKRSSRRTDLLWWSAFAFLGGGLALLVLLRLSV